MITGSAVEMHFPLSYIFKYVTGSCKSTFLINISNDHARNLHVGTIDARALNGHWSEEASLASALPGFYSGSKMPSAATRSITAASERTQRKEPRPLA